MTVSDGRTNEDSVPAQRNERDKTPTREGANPDAHHRLNGNERREINRAHLAKAAALALSARELADELLRLHAHDLLHLQRMLKVRSGASMLAVAQALRARLARDPEGEVANALHDALLPGVHIAASVGDMSEEDLAALLRGDLDRIHDLDTTGIHAALLDITLMGTNAVVRTAVWSAMASREHSGSVAALAWLIADPPSRWNEGQRRAVSNVWKSVRQRCPLLPEHPVTLARLTEIVATIDVVGPGGVAVTDDPLPSAEQLAELMERCDTVESSIRAVRSANLVAIDRALDMGVMPPEADLARLTAVVKDLQAFLGEVTRVADQPSPVSVGQARQCLSDVSNVVTSLAQLERIRRLTRLAAPEYASAEAQQVSELAASVAADTDRVVLAGLDALVTAIEIGPDDPKRSAEQLRVVQTALPQLAMSLAFVASGVLTFDGDEPPSLQDESVELTPPPEAINEVETSVDEPEPSPSPGPEPFEEDPNDLDRLITDLALTLPESSATAHSTSSPEPGGSTEAVLRTPVTSPAPTVQVRPSDDEAGVEGLYAALLGDRHYALVYWLLRATDESEPIAAVYRLVAHAAAIQTSAGPNAAAFADTVRLLDAESLADRPEVQMLVYAASVRAGLLSPTAGAAGPLRDLTASIVRSGSAVEDLSEALLAAIYNGVYLTPRGAGAIAEVAEAEAEHERLARSARNMIQSAPSRTIRYQAATELWQNWMSPAGHLGVPMAIVAKGSRDADDLAVVRKRIGELRSRPGLEAALDRDTRDSRRRGRRIEARAREKILAWTGEVTELLADWVAATENLRDSAAGTWMADPITDLRLRVNAVREQAFEQLEARSRSGDIRRDAAAEAGLRLLREALALLDGSTTLSGTELPGEKLLNGLLTLAPDLPLDVSLRPRRDVEIGDVAAAYTRLSAPSEQGWTDAFNARVARDDQVGAQILIDVLRPADPHLAQRLTVERETAIAATTERLEATVTGLAATLDSDRRFGRLTAEQWSDLSARVRSYRGAARGPRQDFDTMFDDLARLDSERSQAIQTAVDEALTALRAVPMEAERERIGNLIEKRDLTTAHEYLETVRAGRALPGPRDDVDHLRLFYPAFPAMLAKPRGARRPASLTELRRAIEDGQNPEEGRLAEALLAAQIDLSQLGRQRNAAARMGQWTVLAESRSLETKLGSIRSVLEQLGFLADAATPPTTPHVQGRGRPSWMHLTGVRATSGQALIPAFGTAISPAGNTLRILAVWTSPTPQELVELLRKEPTDHAVIVLYFGAIDGTARRDLANEFRSGRKLPPTAVVDDAAFAYLVAQPEPGRDVTMAITLPFTWATPFTPDVAGLVPQEMFYGRTEERDKIVDMMGSCIVYGGRQLGKSALLRAAARDFEDGGTRHATYQSIYKVGQATPVDAVWTTLWPRLADKDIVPRDMPSGDIATELTRGIMEWIRGRPGRQLLLLLDESDSFLDADATDGRFTHVTRFKDLMESTGRAVKVVFAGLHQTARFERLANHPLAHFGDPVCVGPLAPQPAYDLLTRPLQALGCRFADHDHASRVLALANNQPALIQLFGAQLLRNLQRTPAPGVLPQVVTIEDVEAVWADASLRNSFRKRFDWTLNLDPRYKVIAYSVAFFARDKGAASALTAAQLRAECEQWWPRGFAAEDVRAGEFRALLDECVDLGVLSYARSKYRLRTPHVLDLLGSREEVDEFLEQAASMPLPESFDGSLMRPQFGTSVTRGPLTSLQIADLLAPRRQVRLIVGSAALTVERCVKALQDENEKAHHSGCRGSYLRDAPPAGLRNACQQATLRAAGGHAVVLVNLMPTTLAAATDAWHTARDIIATHSGGTLGIVLISDERQGPLWLEALAGSDMSCGVTELRRYDRTDLRLWLTDTTLPFQDDASRSELLAATGGWPLNINKVAEDLASDRDSDTRVDPLAEFRSALARPDKAQALVVASGVRCDPILNQAWTLLVREFRDERSDPAAIAELLSIYAELEEPGADRLHEKCLAEAEYGDTAGVVEVLRALGLLVPNPEDGKLQVEPVMAAATRVAEDLPDVAGPGR